jgi:hypothetical protein
LGEGAKAKPEHGIVLVMQTISDGDDMESIQGLAFEEGGNSTKEEAR